MSTKRTHIMESVDILDRLEILLFQPAPGHFSVDFACKEKGKRFIMDTDHLKHMEQKITAICQERGLKANDKNTRGYIQEFIGRYVQMAYKMHLARIEDIPEGIDDHYKHLRQKFKPLN